MKKLYTLLVLACASASPALAQWNTGATPVSIFDASGQGDYYGSNPRVARTADKKTWIAWKTWGHKAINGGNATAVRTYLQLLDRDGVPQFSEPIEVNDHITPTWWSNFGLAVAADGSAIVTVADSRTEEDSYVELGGSPQTTTPAVYKIDQEGNFLWGLDGVEFREYNDSPFTNVYVVGDDTYFLFNVSGNYDDEGNFNDTGVGVYMQRISDDGVAAWEKPVKVGDAVTGCQILPSTDGDFLFFDSTPDGARVHRYDHDLNEVWGEPVTYDEYKYEGMEMSHYRLVPDGTGGACVTFVRNMGNFSHNIRVQHISGDGSTGFGLTGLDAYNADAYDHNYPYIAANPETEQIFVMYASQLDGTGNVMSQLFTFDGDVLLKEPGYSLASKSAATNSYFYGLVGCGSLKGGDWIVVYRDLAGYGNSSFIIRRYDSTGKRVWTRTIGRDLSPTNISLVVDEEATYLFYREEKADKEPGIKIFRIASDGSYNVTYTDETEGIEEHSLSATASTNSYFTLDGKQLSQPQKGLNIVKSADGKVEKRILP